MSGIFSFTVEGHIPEPLLKAVDKGEEHMIKAFVEDYSFSPKPLEWPKQGKAKDSSRFFSKITPLIAYEFCINIDQNRLSFRMILLDESLIVVMKKAEEIFFKELGAVIAAAATSANIGKDIERSGYVR